MATSLELAITAIRSGRKEEGRQLLNLLIQQNPNDEMAWLWMSSVVSTDEQRARCLYHVLAINPESEIARRGLEVLGIVVSDSRPVKIPRDSQPIRVNPTGAPMPKMPSTPVPPASTGERRPFRVDPQAITQELPFKPLKEPFGETAQDGERPEAAETQVPAGPARRRPSAFNPVAHSARVPKAKDGENAGVSAADSSQQKEKAPGAAPADADLDLDTSVLRRREPVAQYDAPALPAGGAALHTRPSQPVVTPHATMPMPSPWQQAGPPQPGAGPHSQVTMGMGTQYVQAHNPWQQPAPGFHHNPTMGMPQYPGQQQAPPPSEPVSPVHANPTMGMPGYAAPYQNSWPQNPAFFSNATMAMPTMTPAVAGAFPGGGYSFQQPSSGGLPSLADFQAVQAAKLNRARRKGKAREEDDEEDEGVNVMAVIIFGSLSVTALGGLGMLILLMFTGS